MGAVQGDKEGSWEWLSYDEATKMANLKVVLGLQETETEIEFLDEDTIQTDTAEPGGAEHENRIQAFRGIGITQ